MTAFRVMAGRASGIYRRRYDLDLCRPSGRHAYPQAFDLVFASKIDCPRLSEPHALNSQGNFPWNHPPSRCEPSGDGRLGWDSDEENEDCHVLPFSSDLLACRYCSTA